MNPPRPLCRGLIPLNSDLLLFLQEVSFLVGTIIVQEPRQNLLITLQDPHRRPLDSDEPVVRSDNTVGGIDDFGETPSWRSCGSDLGHFVDLRREIIQDLQCVIQVDIRFSVAFLLHILTRHRISTSLNITSDTAFRYCKTRLMTEDRIHRSTRMHRISLDVWTRHRVFHTDRHRIKHRLLILQDSTHDAGSLHLARHLSIARRPTRRLPRSHRSPWPSDRNDRRSEEVDEFEA